MTPDAAKERAAIVAWLQGPCARDAISLMLGTGLPGGTRTQRVKNKAFADGFMAAVTLIRDTIKLGEHQQ